MISVADTGFGSRFTRWIDANWFRFAILGLLFAALWIGREHLVLVREGQRTAAAASEARRQEEAQRQERGYLARRRMECYDLYTREREKYNNVLSHDYDRQFDRCEVIYRHSGPKRTNTACRLLGDSTSWLARDTTRFAINLGIDCGENQFRNTF